jgi:charged multivesicular body protein 3
MDREIRGIETAQNKVKIQLKQLAAKNDLKNCKMLAKEIVRSNKQKDRLFTSKARLNSIRMQLQHQLGRFFFFFILPPSKKKKTYWWVR